MKLHNSGTLGLGVTRNVSGISNSLLQQCCDLARLVLQCLVVHIFCFLKEPVKELINYHLCRVGNMRTKYFYYFQGLRAPKCHRTKRLNRVNNGSKLRLQKTFSCSTPPPTWISRVFDLPPTRISRISPGGVNFFQNNLMQKFGSKLNQPLSFNPEVQNPQK